MVVGTQVFCCRVSTTLPGFDYNMLLKLHFLMKLCNGLPYGLNKGAERSGDCRALLDFVFESRFGPGIFLWAFIWGPQVTLQSEGWMVLFPFHYWAKLQ